MKRLNGTHSNFRAEWLKILDLLDLQGQPQNNNGIDLIIVNAVRSSSEIQTSQCCCDAIIPKNTKVHWRRYSRPIFNPAFHDLQMPRNGRQYKDSPNFVSTETVNGSNQIKVLKEKLQLHRSVHQYLRLATRVRLLRISWGRKILGCWTGPEIGQI